MSEKKHSYIDASGEVRRAPARRPNKQNTQSKQNINRRQHPQGTARGAAVQRAQNQRPSQPQMQGQRPAQRPPQAGQVRRVNAQRPGTAQGQQVRRNAQRPAQVKKPQARGAQMRAQRNPQIQQRQQSRRPAQRDWVYPEGYVPPKGHRPLQNAKRAPQKKKKPKQSYKWLGVLIGGVAVRLLVGILIAAAVLGLMYRGKFYAAPEIGEETTYIFTDVNAKQTVYEASIAEAYTDGRLMVSYSDLAAWLGMAQVGDIYTMRFVFPDAEGGESDVVFHNASHNAFVNGSVAVMEGRTRFDNGEVWVPLSFVQQYMTNLEVTSEGGKVTVARGESEVSFALAQNAPLENCEVPEE